MDEEPFGPMLPVIKYHDVDDAVRRANDTATARAGRYGRTILCAGRRSPRVSKSEPPRSTSTDIPDATIPFGGAKESGLGREYSALGLKSYMEAQVISVSPLR